MQICRGGWGWGDPCCARSSWAQEGAHGWGWAYLHQRAPAEQKPGKVESRGPLGAPGDQSLAGPPLLLLWIAILPPTEFSSWVLTLVLDASLYTEGRGTSYPKVPGAMAGLPKAHHPVENLLSASDRSSFPALPQRNQSKPGIGNPGVRARAWGLLLRRLSLCPGAIARSSGATEFFRRGHCGEWHGSSCTSGTIGSVWGYKDRGLPMSSPSCSWEPNGVSTPAVTNNTPSCTSLRPTHPASIRALGSRLTGSLSSPWDFWRASSSPDLHSYKPPRGSGRKETE